MRNVNLSLHMLGVFWFFPIYLLIYLCHQLSMCILLEHGFLVLAIWVVLLSLVFVTKNNSSKGLSHCENMDSSFIRRASYPLRLLVKGD